MNSLVYLASLRFKAMIRKIYSRPLSAIFTTLAIIVMLGLLIFYSFFLKMPESEKGPFSAFLLTYLFVMTIMILAIMFQKRTALFTNVDANLLLCGPFSLKQILLYGIIGSCGATLALCLMNYLYITVLLGAFFDVSPLDYLILFITSMSAYFIILVFTDFLYVRFMDDPKRNLYRRLIVGALVVFILLIFAYHYYINRDLKIDAIINSFMDSKVFSLMPVIGWSKFVILNFHNGEYLLGLLALGGMIVLAFVLTILTMNTRSIDPEVICDDARYYDALKERSKNNSNLYQGLKVRSVKNVSFKKGAGAIASRLILDMRKTNSFITKTEVMLILLYLAISYFSDYDYAFYSRYVAIILYVITLSSNYNDELSHHYIYLIPDTPLRKLWALLWPSILKVSIIIVLMMTLGIVLGPTPLDFIAAIFELFGYALLFISSNIWSLRILNKGQNQVASQFIKMLIVIIALIPSVALGLVFTAVLYTPYLFSFISSFVNIIIALIFIYLSKGIVSGAELLN